MYQRLQELAVRLARRRRRRTAAILSIIATCIEHYINPRGYLHVVARLILAGWPQRRLPELLLDRVVALHPELAAGDPAALRLAETLCPYPLRGPHIEIGVTDGAQ